jgi:hypothetical protein
MLEPPLPNADEFCFEPSRHYVHRDTAIRVVVDTGDLLGCDSGIPGTGQQCSDDIERLSIVQESLRKGDRLVLIFLISTNQCWVY